MRVLMVGRGAPERGGIAAFLADAVTGPLAGMVDVDLLNLTRPAETPQGGAASWANLRRTAVDTARVWRRARGHDVVHIHSALAPTVTVLRAGLLVLAARAAGARVVVHAHGGRAVGWLDAPIARLAARLSLGAASRVVAVAEVVADAFAGVLGRDVVTFVPNGVDLTRFRPTEGGGGRPGAPPRLLYVGILTPRKGVLDLLTASAELGRRGVEHELVLVGGTPDEGPEAAEPVISAAESAGATMPGAVPREEMSARYRDAEVFCLPSWWEAMPLTVLEAMASGLPVVATDVGAVSTIVRGPEDGGAVVPVEDPMALADALEPLLCDPDRRDAWGHRARERAADFGLDRTAERLAQLYAEVCR